MAFVCFFFFNLLKMINNNEVHQFPITLMCCFLFFGGFFCDKQQLQLEYNRGENWTSQKNEIITSPCWMPVTDLNQSDHKFKF